ncbi:sphingosine 1-phosphate receptor 1-like [Anneissia japonica]|uniref:sphingosine 1-phosphate receptor 1-like n=1 Tax=Anneissia japonica TaxID=1529436 RepID=UPI0014259695|nr:sphingosine 1-phosphate receptor 1-like [Anneissia japonica]XP_033119197.1 sphingosine 1-phosphate receptor 1-like [Anneissia japonica]XP_033119198.1 sphingosine 1-phosphate receptor 1-like [Anneissia japonica]
MRMMEMDSDGYRNCSVTPVDVTESDVFGSSTVLVLFSIYFSLICICSIVENVIILLTIIRVKRLHKRRNILIFNLAVTDLLAGIVYPSFLNGTHMEGMALTIGIVSVFTILAIATERFLKIVVFTKSSNAHICTTRQLVGASITAWVIVSVILLPISYIDNDLHRVIFFTLGPLCVVVVMIGISVFYLAIFLKIRYHDKRVSANLNRAEKYTNTKVVLKAYVVIVIVYAICWLPWAAESLRIMFTMYYGVRMENRCIVSTSVSYVGVAMILLNSAINPIIYWLRLPDFRHGTSELFRCCRKENICCFKGTPVVENSSPNLANGIRSSTTDVRPIDRPNVYLSHLNEQTCTTVF